MTIIADILANIYFIVWKCDLVDNIFEFFSQDVMLLSAAKLFLPTPELPRKSELKR
jgi:hypothetical protein